MRETLGADVPLRSLLAMAERLRALAEAIKRAQGAAVQRGVRSGARPSRVPLSYEQEQLWFLDQLAPADSSYNMPFALRVPGALAIPLLQRAVDELVARHEVLRTRFEADDGEPRQIVQPPASLPIRVVDLTALPGDARERALQLLATEEARRPFYLGRAPLCRVSLVRLAPDDQAVMVTLHHIIGDGWLPVALLWRELAGAFESLRAGWPSPFPRAAGAVRRLRRLAARKASERRGLARAARLLARAAEGRDAR